MGFPESSLSSILAMVGNRTPQKSDTQIIVSSYNLDSDRFLLWKKGLELTVSSRKSSPIPAATSVSTSVVPVSTQTSALDQSSSPSATVDNLQQVINKIRSYQVISKSPIECQQFILDIQQDLIGY